MVATDILEEEGHQVVVVTKGKDALAALDRQAFDLALLQMEMTDMDAFTLTAAIRQKEWLEPHLPIVGMTNTPAYQERCGPAGLDDYICRPVERQELLYALQRHVKVVDWGAFLQNQSRNTQLALRFLSLMPEELDDSLRDIRKFFAEKDYRNLFRSVHTLKGSFRACSAGPMRFQLDRLEAVAHELENILEPMRELEDMALHENFPKAEQAIRLLERLSDHLMSAITPVLKWVRENGILNRRNPGPTPRASD
jgi:CheY-like chemotaxis protein